MQTTGCRWRLACCAMLLTAVANLGPSTAQATVLFSDDFESYTAGATLPTSGPWTTVTAGAGTTIPVVDHVGGTDPFSAGANQFLRFDDQGTGGITVRSRFENEAGINPKSVDVLQISFDFYEPNVAGGGYFQLRVGRNNLSTGTDLAHVQAFDNRTMTNVAGSTDYQYDAKYHVDMIFYGNAHPKIGKYDLWLDGVQKLDGQLMSHWATYSTGDLQFETLTFLTQSSNSATPPAAELQEFWIDNILVQGFQAPEPASVVIWILSGLGLGLTAVLRRRRQRVAPAPEMS